MKYQVQLIALMAALVALVAVCDGAPFEHKDGFDLVPICTTYATEESCDGCCRGLLTYGAGMIGKGSIVDATIFERTDSYDQGCRCKGIEATGEYKFQW